MFKRFFIVNRDSENYDYIYPNKSIHSTVIEKPFLFPCSDFERYDHGIYVVVLTEISGDKNFIITKFINEKKVSISFESDHPWFEIIYTILDNVKKYELYLPGNWKSLEKYFSELSVLPHPEPGVVFYIPAVYFNESAVKIVVPNRARQKPFSVFIKSLHKQIQFDDWMVIFESLLLERWIVFHSRHLNRVTNCLFASLSLIFPLDWVHLIFPCLSESSINCLGCPSPFVAGIHSCLVDKVIPILSPGTLVVNIDEGILNFVTGDTDIECEDEHMPKSLVNFLSRNLIDNEPRFVEYMKSPNNKEDVQKACKLLVNGFLCTMAVLIGKYRNCSTWKSDANRFVINKTRLSQSRGELLEPFIAKILESQMLYQFLDDMINRTVVQNNASVTFAVDGIDDFETACKAMEKWHPDHYTEVIANMASRSRRKINDLAGKMRDIGKKNQFGLESIENGNSRFISMATAQVINETTVTAAVDQVAVNHDLFMESDPSRNKWITFDDDNKTRQDIFSCDWKKSPKFEECDNIIVFEDTNIFSPAPVVKFDKEMDNFLDFDPLYRK